jgi:hypothetical protein
LAFALAILVFALPANSHTLRASTVVAADQLFDVPLSVSNGELPVLGTILATQPEEYADRSASGSFPFIIGSLSLSLDDRDNRSENEEGGVRRFILLAILFGAALRYLTSPAFYRWAADVFNPLDWC